MKVTRRLFEFARDVANIASEEPETIYTFQECLEEYIDQITTDDYACVVAYASEVGVKIPRALK